MIKASGRSADGRRFALVGLSRRNCEGLLEGKPIIVRGGDVGLPVDVYLIAGESESDMLGELQAAGVIIGAGAGADAE